MLKAHLRKKHTKSYWYVFLFMHFFMEPVIPAMTGSRVDTLHQGSKAKRIGGLTEKKIRTYYSPLPPSFCFLLCR